MKAVLVSVKAEDCELIMESGEGTIVQTVRPKLAPPFTVYIFCTEDFEYNNNYGFKTRVLAEEVVCSFVCDKITEDGLLHISEWHISNPKFFANPLPLDAFFPPCHGIGDSCSGCRFYNMREGRCVRDYIYSAPATWRYVEYIG